MSQLMARYCLTGSRMGTTYPRASPPVTTASLSTALQAGRHLSLYPRVGRGTAFQAGRGISVVPVVVRTVRAGYDAREGWCVSLVLLPALRLNVVERE